MALAADTKLGPYEIISPLGAGGMSEVYRARDTRVDHFSTLRTGSGRRFDLTDMPGTMLRCAF
jgi:serine/threonine protein kinase